MKQILISENTAKDANIDLDIAGKVQIEPKGMKDPVTRSVRGCLKSGSTN